MACPVADPGIPRGGGANYPGAPTYNFAKFSRKLHEIERIWMSRGCTSLAPLPKSDNAVHHNGWLAHFNSSPDFSDADRSEFLSPPS